MTPPVGAPAPPRRVAGKYVVLAIVLVTLTAAAWAVKLTRYHFLPRRFHEVEAGQLYRSGYIEPVPLRRVLNTHKIKTILCLLNNEPDNPDQQKEEAVARETGVKLVRIGMPGDGRGRFDDLDQAADVMAETPDRPILVHCFAGQKRTGAAYAAYRMKHCGWSFEQAIAEGDKYGLPIRDDAKLVDRLRAYHDHLAAASQPAASVASKP